MNLDTDLPSKVPLKKSATPTQMIYLGLAMVSLLAVGWVVKGYFDDKQTTILAAISEVGARNDKLGQDVKANSSSIEAIRRYYWSNADMQQWAQQLDRANRTAVPALVVPEVPRPPAP